MEFPLKSDGGPASRRPAALRAALPDSDPGPVLKLRVEITVVRVFFASRRRPSIAV